MAQDSLSTEPGQSTPVQYMDTIEAYDKWAEVYDTDGNFLQALDTLELRTLLPKFLALVANENENENENAPAASDSIACPAEPKSLKLVDLGCGTGRNTHQLLLLAPRDRNTQIIGLDASPRMLDVARKGIQAEASSPANADTDTGTGTDTTTTPARKTPALSFDIFDLMHSPPSPPVSSLRADGVISTLVVEHIPLAQFFAGVVAVLRPGGYLLLTNMHSDMGAISQAGFVDVATGRKIRPTSYAHSVGEVVAAAKEVGLEVVSVDGEGVRERSVDDELVGVLGKRARKWVGVVVWFGICFRRVEKGY